MSCWRKHEAGESPRELQPSSTSLSVRQTSDGARGTFLCRQWEIINYHIELDSVILCEQCMARRPGGNLLSVTQSRVSTVSDKS